MRIPGEKIKNILKVRKKDDLSLNSSDSIEYNFDTKLFQSGNGLSLNSVGKVVVGKDINCIRATFHLQWTNLKGSARKIIYISKNNSDYATESKTIDASYERMTLSTIIPVKEGDIISTKVTGVSGEVINASVSYLEIEEIENVVWNKEGGI